ncbi:MAG: hypothetical protein U9O98_10830, partial [Asgard group archaeon]|nr:hypothetical protein [Asgard group archaeon]
DIMKNTSKKGVLVVGDAAGQTKATTGGGVITGGIAGRIAGRIAALAMTKQDFSKKFLKQYDRLWKQKLHSQLFIMALFRKAVDLLSDKGIDLAFQTIRENNLQKLIEQQGDIDSQARVILKLLQQPAIIKLALKLIPTLKF